MLKAVLVALDLTPASDRVVARVARLPLDPNARIVLLHVVPESVPAISRAAAERDAKRALETEVETIASAHPGATVEAMVTVGRAAAEISRSASTVGAELVVMGRGAGKVVRDTLFGSTAERVVRQSLVPVLVVRLRARKRYARPLLAIDFDEAAEQTLAMLLRVLSRPRPLVGIVHAYDAPYQSLVYPSLPPEVAENDRAEYRTKALAALRDVIDAGLARAGVPPEAAPPWKNHVVTGGPRTVIEKIAEKTDADLIAIGTRGQSVVAQAFLGTVAGDVLRDVACDVLVVPPHAASDA